MSVNSDSFMLVAQHDLALGQEIGYRMAVGRSYYAVFHKLLESFNQYQFDHSSSGTHSDVYDYLLNGAGATYENKDPKQFKIIAYQFMQAKQKRVHADYNLALDYKKETAEIELRQAEKLIKKIEDVFAKKKMSA